MPLPGFQGGYRALQEPLVLFPEGVDVAQVVRGHRLYLIGYQGLDLLGQASVAVGMSPAQLGHQLGAPGDHRCGQLLQAGQHRQAGRPTQVVDVLDAQEPGANGRQDAVQLAGIRVALGVPDPFVIQSCQAPKVGPQSLPILGRGRAPLEGAARLAERLNQQGRPTSFQQGLDGQPSGCVAGRQPSVGRVQAGAGVQETVDLGRGHAPRGRLTHQRVQSPAEAGPGRVQLQDRSLADAVLVEPGHVDDQPTLVVPTAVGFEGEQHLQEAAAKPDHRRPEGAGGIPLRQAIDE